jgi:putative tricarboxylic transport membrane protein
VIRADHVAGGAFAALGLLVLALSGDLPIGTLSFPGAGMMPKLLASLLIVFGILLVVRARGSAPVADVAWQDLAHAMRVTEVTSIAIAFYQTLGFVITMGLLLFVLIFGVERRAPVSAAAFSAGVVALTYLLFNIALKTPLEPGLLGY